MNGEGRKGEISELKSQLRQLAGSRATGAIEMKRELFKKIISHMTIGVDVSPLFSEMVMCGASSDVVVKKMCYLYVCNYAAVNPEIALLTINFLLKDCQDDDPMIRGLALRSLCGLRVKNLVEYLTGPLQKGLKDSNGYVRTNAVMGVLKLYHLTPMACKESKFVDILKNILLRDTDPQVVINCLCALQEIFHCEVGLGNKEAVADQAFLYSKPLVYNLLNRVKEFSEWGQCIVLEHIVKYIPSDANDIFDFMNLLEDRLQHANSAVVLATVKVFLHLTMSMADVHQQVYERIKAPLLTLMTTSGAEQSFAVLSHLQLLATRAPMLFAADFKHFYCRYNDSSCVKKLKLEILTAIANESNTYEIVSELSEYVADVDVNTARAAIRAVGKIALESYDINGIVDRLLQFLDMDTDYITAESLVLVKDLVRKYPQWSEDCLSVVGNVGSREVVDTQAKCALVWMLGEFGGLMEEAPYTLERMVESWDEEEAAEVRLELLTAVAKLFFQRPPECQPILGKALSCGVADANQDVHDRALLYLRLLQTGVDVAEKVINPAKQAVSVFADNQSSEAKDKIFDEFNSLAVVYRKPSYLFLDKGRRGEQDSPSSLEPPSTPPLALTHAAGSQALHAETPRPHGQVASEPGPHSMDLVSPVGHGEAAGAASLPAAAAPTAAPGLVSLDDLLGISAPPAEVPQPAALNLVSKPTLDAGSFQKKWGQLPVAHTATTQLSEAWCAALTGPQPLLRHMAACSIVCMASGGVAPNFKFFFYAQRAGSPHFFLVELVVNKDAKLATAKVKAEHPEGVLLFSDQFSASLNSFVSLF